MKCCYEWVMAETPEIIEALKNCMFSSLQLHREELQKCIEVIRADYTCTHLLAYGVEHLQTVMVVQLQEQFCLPALSK